MAPNAREGTTRVGVTTEDSNEKQYTAKEVEKHNKKSDCWVTLNGCVYDVTKFLGGHPGGDQIILDLAGQDVTRAFGDATIHTHSKAAYNMVEKYRIGRMEGVKGMPTTEATKRFKLDFNKGVLPQISKLGDKYVELIHNPIHYDGTLRLFDKDWMEFFSKTKWFVIPLIWGPVSLAMLYTSMTLGLALKEAIMFYVIGVFSWTLIEYSLHRWVFHLDEWVQFHPWAIVLHFLLHGIHHMIPMDPLRLVFPPLPAAVLGTFVFAGFRAIAPLPIACALFAGGVLGYICYDLTHYFLHHGVMFNSYFKSLKTYHLDHHYKEPQLGYGITSKFWDYVFGTVLE